MIYFFSIAGFKGVLVVAISMRGLWQHLRLSTKENSWERINPYARECLAWNIYVGSKKGGVKQIDTMCKVCGQRVRFSPRMNWRPLTWRGKISQALWQERPDSMPVDALIKEMRARNGFEQKKLEVAGFKRAIEQYRRK